MLLSTLTSLTLFAMLGASPSDVARTNTYITADSDAVLTVDALSHMTALWTSFKKEPDSVIAPRTKVNYKPLSFYLGDPAGVGQPDLHLMHVPSVIDMAATAAQFPSVAADLAHAQLTAEQWEQYRRSYFAAWLTGVVVQVSSEWKDIAAKAPASSVIWQNVKFLQTHQEESDALLRAGMGLPKSPAAGEVAPQLDTQLWLNHPGAGTQTTFGDGHVYILDFTSPTCAPCQSVYPIVDSLYKRFAQQGVQVVYGTVLTGSYGGVQNATPAVEADSLGNYFRKKHHIVNPVAILSVVEGLRTYFPNPYNMTIPHVVLIDGAGTVRGAFTELPAIQNNLKGAVTELMKTEGDKASK